MTCRGEGTWECVVGVKRHGTLTVVGRQRGHRRRKGLVGKHEGNSEALQMAETRVHHPVDFHLKALLTDGFPRHSSCIQAHKGCFEIFSIQQVKQPFKQMFICTLIFNHYLSLISRKIMTILKVDQLHKHKTRGFFVFVFCCRNVPTSASILQHRKCNPFKVVK